MKKNILTILVLLPILAAAQKNYTLSATISGLQSPAMAYLSYGQGEKAFKDSVDIKDGRFTFKGTVEEPIQAFLTVKHNTPSIPNRSDYFPFFIENSKITITAADSIKNAEIKGSVAEKDSREIEALIRPLTNTIIRLQKDYAGKPKDEAYQKASDSVAYLVRQIKLTRLNYIEEHPKSFMALLHYYYYIVDKNYDPATMEPIYYAFTPKLKSSALGQRTLEKIESAKRRQTGVKITDFTQTDLNDQSFTLSSLRGKYVLVDFWASWCVPCRAENPNLVKAYNELKGKNFEVVGVSLDENKSAWAKAVEKDGLNWVHVSDLKGWNNAAAILYNISSVPQNLLINPEGVIIARNLRGEDLTKKLSAYIK
jgi:thiol-disulfide isomerase/thioredoxin